MYKYKNKSKKAFKRWFSLAVVVAVVLMAGGYGGYRYLQRNNDELSPNPAAPAETISYDPPSEEEKQAGDEQKAAVVERQATETKPSTSSQPRSVTPVITYAGQEGDQVEVSAFVPSVFEDGGICTLTATKGSSKITKQTTASKDATTTRCANFVVPRSDFPSSGSWTVVVSYKSTAAQGSSNSQTMEVK